MYLDFLLLYYLDHSTGSLAGIVFDFITVRVHFTDLVPSTIATWNNKMSTKVYTSK